MKITGSSDTAIQADLGQRLRRVRLNLNLTRAALAANIGLSVDTVRNAETGQNVSLETLIRLLRGLGRLSDLDLLLETDVPSPVLLAKRLGKVRQRASGSHKKNEPDGWQW